MPPDPRDKLEITGSALGEQDQGGALRGRPFLSVLFACCNVYARIYRRADGRAYDGRCPRCGVRVRFAIGQGGTDARQFVVH